MFLVDHQDWRQCGGHPAECGNGPHRDTEVLPVCLLQSLAHDQDIPRSHHLLHHLCGLLCLRRNNLECKKGWKRSQRVWRREEQTMDLWANVQKHKHKWTGPQGTLAFGGVLMLVESVVNSVTVCVRLPHSRGRRKMTVMLMKVELRLTVYLDREEGVLIHSVLFKLHLHLH